LKRALKYLDQLLLKNESTAFNYNGNLISKNEFLLAVETLAANISKTDTKRWALCYQDSYKFSIALLAVLYSKRTPILLPNNQLGTVHSFSKSYDGVMSDIPNIPCSSFDLLNTDFLFPVLDLEQQVILFTSGSTGNPKKVVSTLEQLFIEISCLEECFGTVMKKNKVYSTISHQHKYGLLFSVLWPLACSRTIYLPALGYPEHIVALAQNEANVVLVTSPAILKRMTSDICMNNNWVVFSSGGPLPKVNAKNLSQTLGVYPIEVLGSSETGGVAYRQQNQADHKDYWTCLPGVNISIEKSTGCLSVVSDFFGGEDPYRLADYVEIRSDGRFSLLGRSDRIVKVEEKRVSLNDIERRLDEIELISESKALPIDDSRQLIAVIIVLSTVGCECLDKNGKLYLNKKIQNHLSLYFDRVLLPKRFRYVDDIPTNKLGKYILSDLQALFK
jgi:acyl-coenzyme A synthetase/AMP-(fatty) acid ligase